MVAQLANSCHIRHLDLQKAELYIYSNLGAIMARMVGFYDLTMTVDLLSLL